MKTRKYYSEWMQDVESHKDSNNDNATSASWQDWVAKYTTNSWSLRKKHNSMCGETLHDILNAKQMRKRRGAIWKSASGSGWLPGADLWKALNASSGISFGTPEKFTLWTFPRRLHYYSKIETRQPDSSCSAVS